jgi:23S rRNA (uracil1939-C5)-methyltransferase
MVRIARPLYGGRFTTTESAITLPFVLPGERIEVTAANAFERVSEASPQRTAPQCPHFGSCGGCHYQMADYPEQLRIKQQILESLFEQAGLAAPAPIGIVSAEPYHYRNRIRLRIERVDDTPRLGYTLPSTTQFLPITECPIAAPLLWQSALALLEAAAANTDAALWRDAAREVELFCNDDLSRVQATLFCSSQTKIKLESLEKFLAAAQSLQPEIAGIAAVAIDPRTGRVTRTIAGAGAAGLSYRVRDEQYWITRGGFFQVNRFLLGTLITLVCEHESKPRRGHIAWDLYAGVGLFSRVLARSFDRVVAVEANVGAATDNRVALKKLSPAHDAYGITAFDFLRNAMVQRERPDLIVLDPPRAGAGSDVCAHLLKIAAPQMVYVSCDPTTLMRDLQILAYAYDIRSVHLVDLFPQTFHLETVVVLERRK